MPLEGRDELLRTIEAILFASGYPVRFSVIADVLSIDEEKARELVAELSRSYDDRGIELAVLGDECQLCSKSKYEEPVRAALGIRRGTKLSQALMEVLSIVAYRQPVTRAEVEQIRGVKCDYSLQSLMNKELIAEVGRKEALGRPILYGTTDNFLAHFGISSLKELPPMPEKPKDDSDDAEMTDDVPELIP